MIVRLRDCGLMYYMEQMSVVLSRAFNYEQFLRSIEQYRISHLMWVLNIDF